MGGRPALWPTSTLATGRVLGPFAQSRALVVGARASEEKSIAVSDSPTCLERLTGTTCINEEMTLGFLGD